MVGLRDSKLSEKLQLDADLTLEKAVTAARQTEDVKKQQAAMRSDFQDDGKQSKQVDGIRGRGKKRGPKPDQLSKKPEKCPRCGRTPSHLKQDCPAKGVQCHQCGKLGHFKKVCRNTNPKVNSVEEGHFLGAVKKKSCDPWMVELSLNGKSTKFKMDTGANVTVISNELFSSLEEVELKPARTTLFGPNHQPIPSSGQFTAILQLDSRKVDEEVFVVPQAHQALLGRPAIEALGLLQRVNAVQEQENAREIKQQFPRLFQGLGKLEGAYKIRLQEGAKLFALTTPSKKNSSPFTPEGEG